MNFCENHIEGWLFSVVTHNRWIDERNLEKEISKDPTQF